MTKIAKAAPAEPAISARTQIEWNSCRMPIRTAKIIMPSTSWAICAPVSLGGFCFSSPFIDSCSPELNG